MVYIWKILRLPVYVLSIFTQAKSFKSNPILGFKPLNIIGLHIFRILFSRLVFRFKVIFLSPYISKSDRLKFFNDGVLIKENFLDDDEFNSILSEIESFQGDLRRNVQGKTLVYRKFLHPETAEDLPITNQLKFNKELNAYLKFSSTKLETPRLYVEKVMHDKGNINKQDPQSKLHSDTFHPTMKAWLFLDDVTLENGPFKYVIGSSKLSWKRLKWEYFKSINVFNNFDGYSEKGSFRAFDDDLEYLGLQKAKEIMVTKNTLVIANTNGFHCRGAATEEKSSRLSIFASSRANPFNPFPGFALTSFSNFRDSLWHKYEAYFDRKYAKKGKSPSWKKLENVKF